MNQDLVKLDVLTSSGFQNVSVQKGTLRFPGTELNPMRLEDVVDVHVTRSREEVPQVWRVGDSNNPSPAADTDYIISVRFADWEVEGFYQRGVEFRYHTPTNFSGTDAEKRQKIYDQLAAQINESFLPISADAQPAAQGDRMDITDDGNYLVEDENSGWKNPGASDIRLLPDEGGGGFSNADHLEQHTAPVYAKGQGENLFHLVPKQDPMIGNIYAGEYRKGNLSKVSDDQNYYRVSVSSLVRANHDAGSDITGYKRHIQVLFVDDGSGSNVSNLSGFQDFRRALYSAVMPALYGDDVEALIGTFQGQPVLTDDQGSTPTSADGDTGWLTPEVGSFRFRMTGATDGLPQGLAGSGFELDRASGSTTDDEGIEIFGPEFAQSVKVGYARKESITARAVLELGDVTDAAISFGLREKQGGLGLSANGAINNSYNSYAAIDTQDSATAEVDVVGKPNGASKGTRSNQETLTDGTEVEVIVHVDGDGFAYVIFDGNVYNVHDGAGDHLQFSEDRELIPFLSYTSNGAQDPDVIIRELEFVTGYEHMDPQLLTG